MSKIHPQAQGFYSKRNLGSVLLKNMTGEKKEKIKTNKKIAVDCYLRRKRGQTEVEIGQHYGWAINFDTWSKPVCPTARKYIHAGKIYYAEFVAARKAAFGY